MQRSGGGELSREIIVNSLRLLIPVVNGEQQKSDHPIDPIFDAR
jgi:hypothetical protein